MEHSWHMSLAAMVLLEYSNFNVLDINKVIKMALIHWQKHGITAEKVLERNKRIEKGSKYLWGYIQNIIKDAVEKG